MRFPKSLLFCVLFSCTFAFLHCAKAQCNLKVQYEVKPKTEGFSTISIKCLEGTRSAKIQLYDLNTGKVVDEVEKVLDNQSVVVFDNVKPSIYAFYVWLPGCRKPTIISGEKGGIPVEN